MREDGIRAARRAARALLHRLGICSADHIRIEAIARRLGARIVETPLDGAQATLVRKGSDIQILVSDRVADGTARRFSIAHELGHLVLKHPTRPAAELCKPGPAPRVVTHQRDYEAEANAFAAELLMPHDLVHARCAVSPVSLEIPWRIAREFNVSILASASRFVELTTERCAAVFSAEGVVRWTRPSATFTREIEPGKRIDRQSVAWDFFAKGAIDDRAQPVPADAWIETSAVVDIVEHSIASRDFGTVLSLLWIPEEVAAPLGMVR